MSNASISVVPVARDGFDRWLAAARSRITSRLVGSGLATADEASERFDRMCERVLPDGFDSADNHFLELRTDGRTVAHAWFGIDGDDVYVRDAVVTRVEDEQAAVTALEDHVRALGKTAIKWSVYRSDAATGRLLDREGYRPASTTMRLDLRDREARAGSGIVLRPMNQSQFDAFMATSIEVFAGDLAQSGSTSPDAAREESERQFHELLPDGLDSADDYLWSAYTAEHPDTDDTDDTAVGMLWIEVAPIAGELRGFIYDLVVYEGFRRRGYGRAIMQEGERRCIELGAVAIGLNVFGFNDSARALYDDLGYEVVDEVLRKEL